MLAILLLALVANAAKYSCPDDTACIFVENQCPFALYLQRTTMDGNENVPTTVTTLLSDEETLLDISGWDVFPGQRLYAWWEYPLGYAVNHTLDPLMFRDKVEINWCFTEPNTMCYNPTAVDYFALPVMIGPYDSSDCPDVPMSGAYNVDVTSMEQECPTEYIETPPHGKCKSPSHICHDCNGTKPLCHVLDPLIHQCIADGNCHPNSTTSMVYACSDWFAGLPDLCAQLNRGVYGSSDQNDPSLFYQNSPYNDYASYIHSGGAKEYAFPYDDWQGDGASGYHVCETNFMSVTFCPRAVEISTTSEPSNPISTTSPVAPAQAINKDDNKYDTQDLGIAISAAFIFGVMISFVLVGVFVMCKRKQRDQSMQKEATEELLVSGDNIQSPVNESVKLGSISVK